MRQTHLFFAALLACAPAAWAQAPAAVGSVAEVDGVVTMSFGSTVATVQPGTPIFNGARFVSSSSGTVKLNFADGCGVSLAPNQSIAIDSTMSCSQRVASVVNLSQPAAGNFFASGPVLPLVATAALAGAVSRIKDTPITPTPR